MGEKRKKSPEKYSEGSAEREERKAPGKRFLSSSGQERGRKRAKVISSDETSRDLAPKRLRSSENGEEQSLRKRAKVSSCEKRGKKRCMASESEEDQSRRKREKRTSSENQSEEVVPARGRKRAKVISSDEPSQDLASKRLRSPENEEEQSLRKRAKVSSCEKHGKKRCTSSESEENQGREKKERRTSSQNQSEEDVPAEGKVRRVLKPRKPLGQSLADYKFHRVLGQGAFGQVILASVKDNEQLVAVKVMDLAMSHKASVLTEKNVLQMAGGCPFLCRGLAAFQTQKHAFLVMEYLRGGSLGSFLESRKRLKPSAARLFLAEMICGLQHLHSRGIIHRDLKPQNILLDDEGHVKIADFGLAAKNISESNRARARVGTLQYMAPEIHAKKAYAGSVDWWSLGVILCRMLTGHYPFNNKGGRELYKQEVLNASPRYPDRLPGDAADLLNKLLDKNPETRLGVVGDIRDHPFFTGINWKRVERRRAVPPCRPFIPQDTETRGDGQNFIFLDDDSSVSEDRVIPGLSFAAPEWTG